MYITISKILLSRMRKYITQLYTDTESTCYLNVQPRILFSSDLIYINQINPSYLIIINYGFFLQSELFKFYIILKRNIYIYIYIYSIINILTNTVVRIMIHWFNSMAKSIIFTELLLMKLWVMTKTEILSFAFFYNWYTNNLSIFNKHDILF